MTPVLDFWISNREWVFLVYTWQRHIHLWCNTCQPLGGQHCSWANLFHIPASRYICSASKQGLILPQKKALQTELCWPRKWALEIRILWSPKNYTHFSRHFTNLLCHDENIIGAWTQDKTPSLFNCPRERVAQNIRILVIVLSIFCVSDCLLFVR